jgi:hypothetical protein
MKIQLSLDEPKKGLSDQDMLTALSLITDAIKAAGFKPSVSKRNLGSKHFYHISVEKLPYVMLRVMPDGVFNHNANVLGSWKKANLPFTPRKFVNITKELTAIKPLLSDKSIKVRARLLVDIMSWTTTPNNQEALQKILRYGNLLKPYADKVPVLYRGMRVSADQLKEIKRNGLTLTNPTSWTLNPKKARIYATGRAGTSLDRIDGSSYGIIFQLTDQKVMLDIHTFVQKNSDLIKLAELGALPGGDSYSYEPGTLVEEESIVDKIQLLPKHIFKIVKIK